MRKLLLTCLVIAGISFFAGCSGKDSAKSIAKQWCDLNGKVYKAAEGPEKEAAEKARKEFEDKMEAKYKEDKTFFKEIQDEAEKCEAASEGR